MNKIDKLYQVEKLLSDAWLLLYELDNDIWGDIPEARSVVNNAQVAVLQCIAKERVKERDEI